MILRNNILFIFLLYFINYGEFSNVGPNYDTNDWIPIHQPSSVSDDLDHKTIQEREGKSFDRVLNLEQSGEKFLRKVVPSLEHNYRKNGHKRSPQRQRIKYDSPYRFENVLNQPIKHQQYQLKQNYQGIPKYQQQPQQYRTIPVELEYQSPENSTQIQNLRPNIINSELYESNKQNDNKETVQLVYVPLEQLQKQQNINILDDAFKSLSQQKLVAEPQALPLISQNQQQEQQQQQQFVVPQPQQQEFYLDKPKYLNQVLLQEEPEQSNQFELISKNRGQIFLQNNPKTVSFNHQQQIRAEPQEIIELTTRKTNEQQVEQTKQNLFIQNERNPFVPRESIQQQQQRYLQKEEKRKENSFVQRKPQENLYIQRKPQENLFLQREPQQESYFIPREQQQQIRFVQRDPEENLEIQNKRPTETEKTKFLHINNNKQHQQKHFVVKEQQINKLVSRDPPPKENVYVQRQPQLNKFIPREQQQQQENVFILNQPQNENIYLQRETPQFYSKRPQIQNEPQLQQYLIQQETNQPDEDIQRTRLENIQKDILEQTLQVENLHRQIEQQGKSLNLSQQQQQQQQQEKRKPHQPPLAVFMNGQKKHDVESVLSILKQSKSVTVQDQIGPNSPQVFIGPSNLNTPNGFVKFPLPYLSNIDANRIQRKAQQLPFFVAPLNYKEPDGYSKIPLPSPHIGSVVINSNIRNNLNENTRPITNYQIVNSNVEPIENHSNFDNNLNVYSLESNFPRENVNKQLREQTLYQQISGFSQLQQQQQFPQQIYQQEEILSRNPVENTRGLKKHHNKDIETENPTSEIVKTEEENTQTPLKEEYFNRFNENSQSTTQREEIPSNVRNLEQTQVFREDQTEKDTKLEEAIKELENNEERYRIPLDLTNINPHLPGLVNDLQDQQTTTTTTIRPTSTTNRIRGRGRSRFNTKSSGQTTTSTTPYRRNNERRRPVKTTTLRTIDDNNNNYYENPSSRLNLKNSFNERLAEGSYEITTPRKIMEISQNQPNYFVEFSSTIGNEKEVIQQSEEKTEPAVRVVEEYQSQKISPQQVQQHFETSEKPTEIERPTRRRVRVRGRPKNTYFSSTTTLPTPTAQEEQTEFYGFLKPTISYNAQVNNDDDLHIYVPTQHQQQQQQQQYQHQQRNEDTTIKFIGELRPKYSTVTTTTAAPEITTRRSRGRVRGRYQQQQETGTATSTTERTNRLRNRGKSHFTSRTTRQEESETENYPISFLKSLENQRNSIEKTDKYKNSENFKVINVDQFDTAESQDFRSILNSIEDDGKKLNEMTIVTPINVYNDNKVDTSTSSGIIAEELKNSSIDTTTTTTETLITETSTTIFLDSSNEGGEITILPSTENIEDVKLITSTDETEKLTEQTASDLLALQTSTSTEISHETEICYKGKCVKSRNKKFKKQPSS